MDSFFVSVINLANDFFSDHWWLAPLMAGLLLAMIGGPLGSFVIWQRMAYVGESIAHSALLGVALSIWFNTSSMLMIALVCMVIALLLYAIQRYNTLSLNTLLAIIAHTALASGLVLINLLPDFRLDMNSLLFGDLLTVDLHYAFWLYAAVLLIAIWITWRWRQLLCLAINEELAAVEGIAVRGLQLQLNLAIALLIAVSIKAVGVLLVISLLVIPAATSRRWSDSPEGMAVLASVLGMLYVAGGLGLSWWLDSPTGPSIVALAGMAYFVSQTCAVLMPTSTR